MFQMRKVCAKYPGVHESKRQDLQRENRLLRNELKQCRDERQSVEEFWIRTNMGEAQRYDAELTSTEEALDRALAGTNGIHLATLQQEVARLQTSLQQSDLELAKAKADLAEARAVASGHELRLLQWVTSCDEASRAATVANQRAEEPDSQASKQATEPARGSEDSNKADGDFPADSAVCLPSPSC